MVRDGEILFAQPGAQQTVGQAVLSGGTALAGQYSLNRASRLSDLLKAPGALGEAPYTLFGIVVRKDPSTLLRTLIPFTPVSVINGGTDMDLASDDVVRVFSVNESVFFQQSFGRFAHGDPLRRRHGELRMPPRT